MNNLKKVIVLLTMGLFTASCGNAQSDGKNQTKEYAAKTIIKKLNKGEALLVANAIIKDDLIFTEINDVELSTPGQFTANIQGSIYFQSCVFLGSVKSEGFKEVNGRKVPVKSHFAKDVNFIDCDFRKDVDFSESEFERTVNFNNSVFRGNTEFNNMLCMGKQNQWWEISADSIFMMCGTIFRGDLNMMDANFKQGATLQNLTVENFQLSNLKSEGDFDFSNAKVKGEMLFNYAKCAGEVNLSNGRFDSRFDFIGASVQGKCDMGASLFRGNVKTNDSQFAGGCQTTGATFIGTYDIENSK